MGFRTHSVSRPLQWSPKLQQNPLSQDAQKLHMAVMGNQQFKMWNVPTFRVPCLGVQIFEFEWDDLDRKD